MKRCSLLLVLLLAAGLSQSEAADLPSSGKWTLSTDGELISVAAREVPLRKLMEIVNEATPAAIDIDSLPDENVTIRYQNIYLDELLMKLNVSFVLKYEQQEDSDAYELESAWVSRFKAQPNGAAPGGGSASPSPGLSLANTPAGKIQQALGYPTSTSFTNDHGIVYKVPYPLTVKIDGNLDEWPEGLPWHEVTHLANEGVATNDQDISMQFASTADEENLYLAFKITDDKKVLNLDETRDTVNEDSLEVEINGERLMIKRHHVWREAKDGGVTGAPRQFVSLGEYGNAWIIDGDDGWYVELKVAHDKFGTNPKDTGNLSMNVVVYDDDDGGERDNRLDWSSSAIRPVVPGEQQGLVFQPINP